MMEMKVARKRAKGFRIAWTISTLVILGFVTGGAACPRRDATLVFPPPPPVLGQTPTLAEVAAAVNRTSVIRELSSNTARVDVLSMNGAPELTATLSIRRDKDFRLRGSLPIVMGSVLDMGSNSDAFWFEVAEGLGKTLYYARHDQYQSQMNRAVLPVDPTWVMDSLGLVQLNPATVVAGPVMRPDGKLEVRSLIPMASGTFQRVYYIDARGGHVTDQLLFDSSNHQIAKATATRHQYYSDYQCSLPHTVKLELTPKQGQPIVLQIEIGSYVINQILSGDPNLFTMPQGASSAVDLTTIGNIAPVGYQTDQLGPLPYRGLVQPRGN